MSQDTCVKKFSYNAVSTSPYHSLDFNWTIKEFHPENTSQVHVTPELQLPGVTWCFVFYVRNTKKYGIFIRSRSSKSAFVVGTLNYLPGSGVGIKEKVYASVEGHSYQKDYDMHSEIVSLGRDNTLRFQLKIYGLLQKETLLYNETTDQNEMNDSASYRENLIKKIQIMRQNHQISDVQIKVGDETIKAHKFILFAMSSVFTAMFETPTLENSQNIIEVTDFSFQVMELLIQFMYGEELHQNEFEYLKEVCDLYCASDKYQVLDLRDKCRSSLVKKMTIENVWELLDFSERRSDEELKKSVFDFCCTHYKSIIETNKWKNLIEEKPLVASLMLKQFPYISK